MKEDVKKDSSSKFKTPEFSYSVMEKREDSNFLFTLQWGAKDIGFGEFAFFYKDKEMMCDNECMSKEFVKKALCAMVDNCTMTCE